MFEELEKVYYFMKRDVISFASYKTNLVLLVMNALFGALSYAFLGSNASVQSVVAQYGMDFKTYLLIGVAFNTYLAQSLTLVQKTINPWSLEEVLVSPTRLSTFIIGSSLWGFIWSTGVIVIYLGLGSLAFGIMFQVNLIGTALVVGLGIGVFIGFSMIGAGILIVTKQGDPVTALVSILTSVFGNVLYPIQVMPYAFQVIALITPIYYFFYCIRPMLTGGSISMILSQLLILAFMCAVILPVGYLIFSWCLKTSRKNGTLSWF
jgi:ABC-type polysaccharide/polyol phosphate export permease